MFKKNTIRWIGFAVLALMLFLFFPTQRALAAPSHEILRWQASYDVQANGSVLVEERLEYHLLNRVNGILREVDLTPERAPQVSFAPNLQLRLQEPSLSLLDAQGEHPLRAIPQGTGEKGMKGVYEMGTVGKLVQFKVFEPSRKGDRKTFIFRYRLTNAVVVYQDVATFNRVLVDRARTDIKGVDLSLRIPSGAEKSELHIFTKGPLIGYDEILSPNTFAVKIPKLEPGESIETLLMFPPRLVPTVQKRVDREELATILAREKQAADAANEEREKAKAQWDQELQRRKRLEERKALGRTLNPLLGVLGASAVACFIFMGRRFGRERKPSFEGDYYRELPGDYTPAVMSSLLKKGQIDSPDVMATVLDLARKGLWTIEPTVRERKTFFKTLEQEDFILVRKEGSADKLEGLMRHERHLFQWFIEKLGDGRSLVMGDLERILKKTANAYKFQRDYDTFKGYVLNEDKRLKFREGNNTKGSGIFYGVGLFLMACGAFFLFYFQNFLGIPLGILGLLLISYNVFLANKQVLTQFGAEETAKWKAFKRFLLDFSNLSQAEVPSLVLWNHYLVYATSLGVAKEVLEQLPKVYSPQELQDPTFTRTFYPDFYYGRGFVSMDQSMQRALSTATSTIHRAEEIASSRSSSGSGGGGGFSGGSTGGSGGGGGTGTF